MGHIVRVGPAPRGLDEAGHRYRSIVTFPGHPRSNSPSNTPSNRPSNMIDRRAFLLASGAVVLAACGSDKKSAETKSTYSLQPRFAREMIVPGESRMPFSLSDTQALLSTGPQTLTAKI